MTSSYDVSLNSPDVLTEQDRSSTVASGELPERQASGDTAEVPSGESSNSEGLDESPAGLPSSECEQCADVKRENRLERAFLTNMSHELRTPLNGIIGMSEQIRETELNPVQDEYLGMIQTSAHDLLSIINDVLDFSRIESGSFALVPSRFDIREQLNTTVRSLAVRAQQKGLEFVYRLTPGVPGTVIGDARRLAQTLSNLVGNAIKFTERGEIVVDVTVDSQTDTHVTLNFQVRDSGIGIAPEMVSTIFDAFRQIDASTTRKFGGTGLGLAISQQLVEMMGGQIKLESRHGKGSVFQFTATFERTSDGNLDRTALPAILDGLEVLVVDDSRASRQVLEEVLCRYGIKPTLVADGAIALQMLEKAHKAGSAWPLVLIDDRLSRVHGFLIAETIREKPELASGVVMMISPGERRAAHRRLRELHGASLLIPDSIKFRESGDPRRRQSSLERCQELGLPCVMKPAGEEELIRVICQVAEEAALTARPITQEDGNSAGAPRKTGALKVLLAEDNRINQTYAVHLLHKRGYEVSVANNGREVLELLENEFFDIVLMDVQMPELDGYEATLEIRSSGESIVNGLPIVALTAHNNEGDRERCLAAGMNGYVSKPIQPGELFAEIDRILNKSEKSEIANPVDLLDDTATADGESAAPVLDREEVLRRVEGNLQLLRALVGTFETTHIEYLSRIRDAVDTGDADTLETSAHGLKGAVATLGGARARDAASQLELMGRGGQIDDDTAQAVGVLEGELGQLRTALQELVSEGDD
jgi:two-component system, sensor histidine kinase and response regulator